MRHIWLLSAIGKEISCGLCIYAFYYRLMVAGLGFLSKAFAEKKGLKVLVLGQGAGIMSKFFYYNLPNASIEAIEISENIIKVSYTSLSYAYMALIGW